MNVLERLKIWTEESNEDLLNALLESAATIILTRRFPYDDGTKELEKDMRTCRFGCGGAVRQDRSGGASRHSENGIDRTWAAACVSPELLNEVVPMCGGIS